MAKHKKRKSLPTPDPEEPKSSIFEAVEGDLPETEGAAGPPKKPEKILSDSETASYKKKLDKLFWLRIGLALIAGTAATFVFEPFEGEERRWASIGFMIVLFMGTIIVGKAMRMQLPSSDRKKLVTQGIGSYVFLYLFMWIVSYTLLNVPDTGGIAPVIP